MNITKAALISTLASVINTHDDSFESEVVDPVRDTEVDGVPFIALPGVQQTAIAVGTKVYSLLAEQKDASTSYENTVEGIAEWFKRAKPVVTLRELAIQVGVHAEEFREMLETLTGTDEKTCQALVDALNAVETLAIGLKTGALALGDFTDKVDRVDFLDACADQIVTAVGAALFAKTDIVEGLRRVNSSNWSKFVDGKPIFDANGKIAKGPSYVKPYLNDLTHGD